MQHDVFCLVVAVPGDPTSQQAFYCTWKQWKTEVQGKETSILFMFMLEPIQNDDSVRIKLLLACKHLQ
jgi:hypothetical protein